MNERKKKKKQIKCIACRTEQNEMNVWSYLSILIVRRISVEADRNFLFCFILSSAYVFMRTRRVCTNAMGRCFHRECI